MTQILTAQDYRNMPWKNGQGFTLEIARSHGEGLDDFDWRVSIADVKSAGPFSYFPNKQRIIGVLEGSGLVLHVDKQAPITLFQKTFFAFSGNSDVHSELVAEAIRDFNLIYDPAKYSARLQWVNTPSVMSWISRASQTLLFNAAKKLEITVDNTRYVLNEFETLSINNQPNPIQLSIADSADCDFCIIELFSC